MNYCSFIDLGYRPIVLEREVVSFSIFVSFFPDNVAVAMGTTRRFAHEEASGIFYQPCEFQQG